jgi:hypothetical protein
MSPASPHPTARFDLLASLGVLTVVVTFALAGLATDANWPKLLRVACSFATYAGVLLGLARAFPARLEASRSVPFAWLSAAGAAAGVVSGLVRPEIVTGMLVGGTLAAATLLAGVHWLALRHWRRLRSGPAFGGART